MSPQDLASYTSVLGVIVLITQLYLIQIQLKRTTIHSQQEMLTEHHKLVVADKGLAKLLRVLVDEPGQLTVDEVTRLHFLLAMKFGHFETLALERSRLKTFALRRTFVMPLSKEWVAILRENLRHPGYFTYWMTDRHTYDSRFVQIVDDNFVPRSIHGYVTSYSQPHGSTATSEFFKYLKDDSWRRGYSSTLD